MQKQVIDDLDVFLNILPPHIAEPLWQQEGRHNLLEVVMDLGRLPEARFPFQEVILSQKEVRQEDIDYIVSRVGSFTGDNRAGIERTLHRISAIRNRQGSIVGLTCRVGRAVFGTMKIIEDLVQSGKNILLLGRPGVGKTTMLREVARVLADDLKKRVVIVDTSNEIAGDGDIPHPAIGRARRMQVPSPALQHAVMIEAVENHMPEAIVIDEIGTELEALAARTIAERGVQLVGTAHGNALENLVLNPTLCDLIGGIQTVTLGDEEAKRRGTQKSILERKAPPTFDVVVEIQDFTTVAIHPDVAEAVDALLREHSLVPEIRQLDERGEVKKERAASLPSGKGAKRDLEMGSSRGKPLKLYSFGINRGKLEQAAREIHLPLDLVADPREARLVVTSKSYFRRQPQKLRDAEEASIPIYVLRNNSLPQIKQFLSQSQDEERTAAVMTALREAEEAITEVAQGKKTTVELSPQSAYIRRLQHLMAERYQLNSRSRGDEPQRRVEISPKIS